MLQTRARMESEVYGLPDDPAIALDPHRSRNAVVRVTFQGVFRPIKRRGGFGPKAHAAPQTVPPGARLFRQRISR